MNTAIYAMHWTILSNIQWVACRKLQRQLTKPHERGSSRNEMDSHAYHVFIAHHLPHNIKTNKQRSIARAHVHSEAYRHVNTQHSHKWRRIVEGFSPSLLYICLCCSDVAADGRNTYEYTHTCPIGRGAEVVTGFASHRRGKSLDITVSTLVSLQWSTVNGVSAFVSARAKRI